MPLKPIVTEIAGLPVPQLAAQFGTPCYVYDASRIRRRIGDLAEFDVVRYAQKACSNIHILKLVREAGAVVDAVSAGEIHRALAAGYTASGDPPPIVYTADLFDAESLDLCVGQDIHVNCGSPDMIDQLAARAPGRNITLRINPGFGHGHSQKTNTGGEQSKHGVWHEQLADVALQAEDQGLGISGLHMHIGSGTDLRHLSQVCEAMRRAAEEVGRGVRTISAGGGLPVPYREGESYCDLDEYFALWDATRKGLETTFGHKISLEIEPGRYISAESGFLIAEIRAVKKMGGNLFYIVNTGFHHLARPIMYGAYHPIAICPHSGKAEARPTQPVVVGGPLCESGDIFTQREGGFVETRELPVANVGDFLILAGAGAYGFCMASNYNSHPLPPEVLVEDEDGAATPRLIRRRQTYPEMLAAELEV